MKTKDKLLVEVQWLTWWYPKTPSFVFDNFNFQLYNKDFYFILGESWVWKTTLVKFLIRQLTPPRKMIFHKKEDISRFSDKEIQKYRRKIWVIYQDFKLIDWKTVKENIILPLQIVWTPKEKIEAKAKDIIAKVGLTDKSDVYMPQLSWWEKQRTAMARALISSPEFIIADEPTGNLDWWTSVKIADMLIELNNQGNTILFITHDLKLINYVKEKHAIKKINL